MLNLSITPESDLMKVSVKWKASINFLQPDINVHGWRIVKIPVGAQLPRPPRGDDYETAPWLGRSLRCRHLETLKIVYSHGGRKSYTALVRALPKALGSYIQKKSSGVTKVSELLVTFFYTVAADLSLDPCRIKPSYSQMCVSCRGSAILYWKYGK